MYRWTTLEAIVALGLRLTHVIEFPDPDDPAVVDWRERYMALMNELQVQPLAGLSTVDRHARRLRRVVATNTIYTMLATLPDVNRRDIGRQTGRMMSYLVECVPRVRLYCAANGHVRGECECAQVVHAGRRCLNSPIYTSMQSGSIYQFWQIDYEDLVGLTAKDLRDMPVDMRGRWRQIIRRIKQAN